jgi:hypothetical protein
MTIFWAKALHTSAFLDPGLKAGAMQAREQLKLPPFNLPQPKTTA